MMLILTRRIGEVLTIGDEIKITILGVRGQQVRIGVNAPKHVSVHRKEIFDLMQQKNSDAEKNSEIAEKSKQVDNDQLA